MTARSISRPVDGPSRTAPDYASPQACLVEPGDSLSLTCNYEVDALTALKRGLAQYLQSLPPFVHPAGRTVEIVESFDVWQDQEEKRTFPSAVVYTLVPGLFDSSGLTPGIDPNCAVDAHTFVVKTSELSQDLTVDIVCTDPEERVAVAMQLETAFNPRIDRYGFQLSLPFYYNQFASYELADINYPDNEERAFRRNRHITYTVRGTIAVSRIIRPTIANEIRTTVTVIDGNEPC